MGTKYVVVFITTPPNDGERLAEFIVKNQLGACVNVIDGVLSIYRWKGNIEKDKENMLVVKTTYTKFRKLVEEVKKEHPYSVPEIIALPILDGNEDYLEWIEEIEN